ncbi:hypothetical protein [Mycobacterium sp.]|uniref:hypothetical protein n=1 Tax=Mycobacterium sp. TaxID=1785 RepID=UPI003F9A93D7
MTAVVGDQRPLGGRFLGRQRTRGGEEPADILNGLLNGEDNVSLRDGIITIPAFNGLLAPESSMTVYINLSDPVNALGLVCGTSSAWATSTNP